jgi:uncharacterized protein YneF (UPF0154 family)
MNQFMIYIYIPILVLLVLMVILGLMLYSNRQVIHELKEDSVENETVIKNMIQAINYNDKSLHENQKYIYNVYEENNVFENINEINDIKDIKKENNNVKNEQYYNMMKNYDALTNLI